MHSISRLISRTHLALAMPYSFATAATGLAQALLHASVMLGAVCGQASDAAQQALSDYGHAIGLAFQVVDDVLDVTADTAALGKTAGKDADNDKPTYVSLLGLEASQRLAKDLLAQAHAALKASGLTHTSALAGLGNLVVQRSH